MKVTDFFVRRPVFTIVTMALVLILGVVSLFKIPVTLIPNLNPPIGVVVTSYPGASPLEVNEKVTKPLESSLATLPGIKRLQSTAQEGANLTIIEFSWTTDMNVMQMEIMQRLDMVSLPDGVGKPSFMKFDPSQFPIIQLGLQAESADVDLRQMAESLEQELKRTEGVASVNISGKIVEEIRLTLDADKLEEKGLTQTDIIQLVQANNISLPGETVSVEERQLTTRIVSLFNSPEQIAELIISVNPLTGESLLLRDIATVERTEQPQTTITRANNYPALLISVLQQSDANTAQVSDAFQDALEKLLEQPQYADVTAHLLFDQGDYVKLAINNITSSLLFGGLFAMLTLFVFLRGITSPLIVGIAIPYSIIVTFVLIYFADFSLNIMTLGALALGIGMLIDNAIVVIENIERHMALGKSPREATLYGTKEVSLAIISSTLTTVAVFLPVVFITGLIGQIFTEFALTIAFSLFASLVVALTVIPMLASHLLKPKMTNLIERRQQSKFYQVYGKIIRWGLRNRAVVLITTALLFAVTSFMLYRTGTEFIPATDEGYVSLQVQLQTGSSIETTESVVADIEDYIQPLQEVDVIVSVIGGNQQSMSRGTSRANEAELYIKLVPIAERNKSIFELVETMEQDLAAIVGQRAELEFSLTSSSGSAPNTLTFRVTESNEVQLQEAVLAIQQAIAEIDTVSEVTTDLDSTVEEVRIEVQPEQAKEYGLLPAQIAQTVGSMTRGLYTTQIIAEDGVVLPVMTSFGDAFNQSIEALKGMKLRTPAGLFVALEDVATIELAQRPTSIRRSDQASAVAFFIQYATTESLSGISTKVDQAIAGIQLKDTTRVIFSGDRELFDSAKNDMILAILLAVILVYIVLAAQFESFKYPFVMLFSIPLMIVGVALALFITNTLLGITAIIGILVLVGIVVNNGIVLVDYINQQKEQGKPSYEAILIACQDRLRPILMTALTTVLGLIPLALGIGEGTELNQPMAIVVIGGLFASTVLTLLIVPIIYSLMDKETRYIK
ncbi:efflux RND transporter permease subunit [Metasolibacillus meyeri]|uniref:Efflux RND transporter permease subunit n=1 Tax=Metasolibacillus meyeri TaxID=1071052 RepID=A0AAW9NVU0_9BACL|nr:efflux RND transporter permease subunit [Metasolibacillus meyeri]MEC1178705.1 efflux RND transporter permease subunit [Metasolibacillus meyeri]